VRQWASQECDLLEPWHLDVPDEVAEAVKVPVVLLAQKPRANALVGTNLILHQLLLILTLHELLIIVRAARSCQHERAAFSR